MLARSSDAINLAQRAWAELTIAGATPPVRSDISGVLLPDRTARLNWLPTGNNNRQIADARSVASHSFSERTPGASGPGVVTLIGRSAKGR